MANCLIVKLLTNSVKSCISHIVLSASISNGGPVQLQCFHVDAACDYNRLNLTRHRSHMPVITGACLFLKNDSERELPPSSPESQLSVWPIDLSRQNTQIDIRWWGRMLLVFTRDCRRQKINTCIDTKHENFLRKLKTTDRTLTQYSN